MEKEHFVALLEALEEISKSGLAKDQKWIMLYFYNARLKQIMWKKL